LLVEEAGGGRVDPAELWEVGFEVKAEADCDGCDGNGKFCFWGWVAVKRVGSRRREIVIRYIKCAEREDKRKRGRRREDDGEGSAWAFRECVGRVR
jgi:hypothetical protein